MYKKKINDIWSRAGKTFVQSFISAFIVGLGAIQVINVYDLKVALYALMVSSFASAISVVWNSLINYFNEKED